MQTVYQCLSRQCQCRDLCYSPPFDVIFRSACQCCLEMEVFNARANCSGLSDTFLMCGGSLFHWFGLDTEKLRCRSPWYYCCLADDCAVAFCLSAMSMATTFSHAAYSWSRLIAALMTATGKQSIQITVKRPNESGPSRTTTYNHHWLHIHLISSKHKSISIFSYVNLLHICQVQQIAHPKQT